MRGCATPPWLRDRTAKATPDPHGGRAARRAATRQGRRKPAQGEASDDRG